MNYLQFNQETEYIKEFIKLPHKIYSKNTIENPKEIKCILEGKHPLCKYFKLYKFLIYDRNSVVGRFAITIYPNDNTAYIGFFECINNEDVAKYIFDTAKNFAKENNYKRIVGPVDASFWLKYRMKINMFDKPPYTGEPYNKDYYYKMFLDNNYKVIEHYTSNVYKSIDYKYENEKYLNRYNEFIKNGYIIKSLDIKNYDNLLKEMYYLLTDLYKDFPIYKHICQQDFIDVFHNYKLVLNPTMVKLAYNKNKLVGFFISIPNYSDKVHKLNIINILKIMKQKRKPNEYIMLYMGVDKAHTGLGKAIAYSIINELKKSELPSIGALTKDGKLTQNYVEEMIDNRYEYVLMEQEIND